MRTRNGQPGQDILVAKIEQGAFKPPVVVVDLFSLLQRRFFVNFFSIVTTSMGDGGRWTTLQ